MTPDGLMNTYSWGALSSCSCSTGFPTSFKYKSILCVPGLSKGNYNLQGFPQSPQNCHSQIQNTVRKQGFNTASITDLFVGCWNKRAQECYPNCDYHKPWKQFWSKPIPFIRALRFFLANNTKFDVSFNSTSWQNNICIFTKSSSSFSSNWQQVSCNVMAWISSA